MSETTDRAFARALISSGPMEHNPQRIQLFGRLVGSWSADVRLLDERTGVWAESVQEWIFAYTLGGRAVQDVLVKRDESDPDGARGRGSTVRVYDTHARRLAGQLVRRRGRRLLHLVATPYRRDGIRQDGTQTDGRPIRWNFSNITDDSFEWDGWVSDDEGRTWWLEQRIDATRTG
ncbi:hypothetical protein ACRAWC_20870 [Leifsonia sp. L25]|uniref:hypothetical protein n=1 Tax=Leifsonia sp. L25 TaxID=3423957 RepID=UPI003D687894